MNPEIHSYEHRPAPPDRLCCVCDRPPLFKPAIPAHNKATAKYPACGRYACKLKIARMRLVDQREKLQRQAQIRDMADYPEIPE